MQGTLSADASPVDAAGTSPPAPAPPRPRPRPRVMPDASGGARVPSQFRAMRAMILMRKMKQLELVKCCDVSPSTSHRNAAVRPPLLLLGERSRPYTVQMW